MRRVLLLALVLLFGTGAYTPTITNAISLLANGLPTGGDDTTKINSLITQAVNAGVAIYAPAGTYNHAGDIICNGCVIYGDGPATIFRSTQTTATNPTVAIVMEGTNPRLENVQLSNTWTGIRQSNGDSCMVFVTGATGFKVKDTVIGSGASCGVQVYQSNTGEITGNHISGGLADCIIHGGGATSTFDDLVAFNYTYNCGDDGISVDTYTGNGMIYNIRIIGNQVVTPLARGITANGGRNITIANNIITTPASFGIQAGPDSGQAATTQVTITGNICDTCTNNAAFFVWGQSPTVNVTDVTFASNHAYNVGAAQDCFQLGSGQAATAITNVKIIGNDCTAAASNTGVGVATNNATNVTVIGNMIKGFEYGVGNVNAADAGYLVVKDNTFDGMNPTGAGGVYVIYFAESSGFSGATISGNVQRNDGTTIAGFLNISGITTASIEGNIGDNTTNVIANITSGYWLSPQNGLTLYGPITGTATKYMCVTAAGVTVIQSAAC